MLLLMSLRALVAVRGQRKLWELLALKTIAEERTIKMKGEKDTDTQKSERYTHTLILVGIKSHREKKQRLPMQI